MASDDIKPTQPSVRVFDIKFHKTSPIDKKGKKSCIGDWNICPKTMPIVPIITPMLTVNQNGPKTERR